MKMKTYIKNLQKMNEYLEKYGEDEDFHEDFTKIIHLITIRMLTDRYYDIQVIQKKADSNHHYDLNDDLDIGGSNLRNELKLMRPFANEVLHMYSPHYLDKQKNQLHPFYDNNDKLHVPSHWKSEDLSELIDKLCEYLLEIEIPSDIEGMATEDDWDNKDYDNDYWNSFDDNNDSIQ